MVECLQWWSPRGHVLGLEGPWGHIFKSLALALALWLMSLVLSLALRVRSLALALWNFQWHIGYWHRSEESSHDSCKDRYKCQFVTILTRCNNASGAFLSQAWCASTSSLTLHRERSPWHRLWGLCCMSLVLALALPSVSLTPSLSACVPSSFFCCTFVRFYNKYKGFERRGKGETCWNLHVCHMTAGNTRRWWWRWKTCSIKCETSTAWKWLVRFSWCVMSLICCALWLAGRSAVEFFYRRFN